MKIFSICLGNQRGEFEMHFTATNESDGKYKAVANGLVYCETEDISREGYEEIREIVMDGVRINTVDKELAN